jgi:hypothetical protein
MHLHPANIKLKPMLSWEADGERFAPGIVIDGHEKRQAPG